ncbi:MAG: hypothetical protein ACYC6B_02565 [Thermoleophilia bacterium]
MYGILIIKICAEPRFSPIDFDEIAVYPRSWLQGIDIILGGPLLKESIGGNGSAVDPVSPEWVARDMARAQVRRFNAPSQNGEFICHTVKAARLMC